jgi:hypothetical protein
MVGVSLKFTVARIAQGTDPAKRTANPRSTAPRVVGMRRQIANMGRLALSLLPFAGRQVALAEARVKLAGTPA